MATAAPLPLAAPHGGLRGLLARHPLVSFFAMAYALTWLAWSPWYLSEDGIGLLSYDGESVSDYLNTVALILGPTLSAFIMTGVTEGREGVRRLLRRIVLWRVGFRWYLFVLAGIPAIIVVSTVVVPGRWPRSKRRLCHPRCSCTWWLPPYFFLPEDLSLKK